MWLYYFLRASLFRVALGVEMEPYAINLVPGTSVATNISQLQATIVVNMQDPLSEFHDVLVRTNWLLWSLPFAALWYDFRLWYHDFMVIEISSGEEEEKMEPHKEELNLDEEEMAFAEQLEQELEGVEQGQKDLDNDKLDSSFDSGEELYDTSDLDYDPFRDC